MLGMAEKFSNTLAFQFPVVVSLKLSLAFKRFVTYLAPIQTVNSSRVDLEVQLFPKDLMTNAALSGQTQMVHFTVLVELLASGKR